MRMAHAMKLMNGNKDNSLKALWEELEKGYNGTAFDFTGRK